MNFPFRTHPASKSGVWAYALCALAWAGASASVIVPGCASTPSPGEGRPEFRTAVIRGTASYRERMALPPGSVLSVQLLDVTDRSRPLLVAELREPAAGEVPLAFNLLYDPESVRADARYALTATLGVEGSALWRTAAPMPTVPSGRADAVSLLLVQGRVVELAPVGMAEPGGARGSAGNQLDLPTSPGRQ